MTKNHHRDGSPPVAANQNTQMSEDPADGNRESFLTGKDGTTPVEKAPPNDKQDKSTIEAFGEEGAGIAPKE